MRRIIAISLFLALLWMGWWVVGSTLLERSLTSWIEERQREGWVAEYSDLSVRGFPNRFDTRIADLTLADPATGIAWQAPFFQILQLSYRPNSAILVWPDNHSFATPWQSVEIQSDRARGSIALRPTPSLELDRSTVVLDEVVVSSSLGWQTALKEARFSVGQAAAPNSYRLGAEMTDLSPADATIDALNPTGLLPDLIDRLRLDATLDLTAPLDRHVIEDERPQITRIALDDLSAKWGDATFRAAGLLDIDAAGIPEGDITIRAQEWRRILDMAVGSGALAQGFLPLIDSTLELMAGLSGSPDDLDATLSFRNGRVSFGPIPLGPAPRIILR